MKILAFIFFGLLSSKCMATAPDFFFEEVIAKIHELYPVKTRLVGVIYEQENDHWVFYYIGNENCIDCDFQIVMKDNKSDPKVTLVADG
ncbi:hypothetical protein [Aurantivibrio plasticivorans]